MVELDELLDARYFGNTTWQWGVAAAVAIGLLLVLLLLRKLIRTRYQRLAATPQVELLEIPLKVASHTTSWFLLIASIFLGMLALELPAKASRALQTIFTIAVFWQVGLWATTAVLASLQRRQHAGLLQTGSMHDRAVASSLGIIGFLARATIWSFVLLLTLDNLGIQIKPLLAGLGIGGIAVALAAQNILGDLFASLSIALDRPFVVGDSLQVDEFNGTVEYIGVKSTRLRSISGEQIIIPNSNLLASRVRNNARMRERRVVLNISVDQDTPRKVLEKIPGQIRALIESQRDVRFDRSHFAKIGASSFDFEAVYIVLTPDYGKHMDILQNINLQLIDMFAQDGISFAQPSQRLYVEQSSVQSHLLEGGAAAKT